MKVGLQLPQGWNGDYRGWDAERAFRRMVEIAANAERIGFESLWLGEHVSTRSNGNDPFFEAMTAMSALAVSVPRVRLGFTTLCSPFRNPALTAKMAGTIDAMSGGRLILGLGAGWKEDEFVSYGYRFGSIRERLEQLEEHLEIVSRLVRAEVQPVSFEGRSVHLRDAINNPGGVQRPRIPILVGGNGPNVTFRLAARYADELNVGGPPEESRQLIDLARARCEEVGRDPATLAISITYPASWNWRGGSHGRPAQPQESDNDYSADSPLLRLPSLVDALAAWQEQGFERVIATAHPDVVATDDALYELRDDCLAAGLLLTEGEVRQDRDP